MSTHLLRPDNHEPTSSRKGRAAREIAQRILTPDNHALFKEVCDWLNTFKGVSITALARQLGVEVDDLCRWVIGFKEPRPPAILPKVSSMGLPRDPELRAEMVRLRRREASLVTVATEAPEQLERVQRRILCLERAH